MALAAAGVYLAYRSFDLANRAADAVSSGIAAAWLKMFPLGSAMQLLGNVKFPGNLIVPIQTLHNQNAIRKDSSGNVFVRYADLYWQLQPQVNGVWPAVRV